MDEPKKPGELARIRDDVEAAHPARRVMPGVEGGHDGLPGSEPPRGPAAKRAELTTAEYVAGVRSGDRTLLARAITLVESNAPAHFEQAQAVVQALLPHRGQAVRVGITGTPGAGKSTFIETLGTRLTARGHMVAVTAVDPSSTVTGGSVLGDKTRMERLGTDPRAFVRPSPSGGTLGGVTRKTREAILLFEAAGYDVVIVETVGVGQSETVVRSMVDFFLLLLAPGGGDELQGIKKGVVELADAVLVNKADGERRHEAELARGEYERALHYLRPATEGWHSHAFTGSALTGEGIDEIWHVIETFLARARDAGVLERRRRDQELAWVHALVRDQLEESFRRHPAVQALLPGLERAVREGTLPAVAAARRLLDTYRGGV